MSPETSNAIIAERDEIVAEGFAIVETDMERPFKDLQNVDRGDVAAVLANTNPAFRMNLETGDLATAGIEPISGYNYVDLSMINTGFGHRVDI